MIWFGRGPFLCTRAEQHVEAREPEAAGVLFGGPLQAFPSVLNQRNTIQVARLLNKRVYQLWAQA